jgi:hypothetical protein
MSTRAVESLEEWISELLIEIHRLRLALMEVKARERMDCFGRDASSD